MEVKKYISGTDAVALETGSFPGSAKASPRRPPQTSVSRARQAQQLSSSIHVQLKHHIAFPALQGILLRASCAPLSFFLFSPFPPSSAGHPKRGQLSLTAMKDPFPFSPPPEWVQNLAQPLATRLNLPTLPLHIHEIVFAIALYTFINTVLSPWLSTLLCPKTYPHLDSRTRISWDVHVVSLFQSVIICALALWVAFKDEERKSMGWEERIWGYTGAVGLITSMACGYFIWDLAITAKRVDIFGWGMLAHAISATAVFSLGFRPFVNYYAPVFILYELSSPFNNFHWFLDKLQLTGSTYQWVNGIVLIGTFFSCRLVWGNINSIFVFGDMWTAYRSGMITTTPTIWPEGKPPGNLANENDLFRYTAGRDLPFWLAASYLGANIVLNGLNIYWMGKMIETVRKRFDPPFGTKGVVKGKKKAEMDAVKQEEPTIVRSLDEDGTKGLEIQGREVRSRRRG
ncbi:hypothetical protein CAC42_6705 [Sphaceloma murrayae]|uniref:TLC domain-containing protein n=1 Tax=Sphaceloma murrayae TaxID=2082308 RepID=A0A2K1QH20_9PEZI|nr:hypothetical protein CAC42_6705 [Sphaceloma murrayae]